MAQYMYERLSAQDNGFLVAEKAHTPMHIAAVAVYEQGGLRNRDGGVDVRRIKQFVEGRLHEIPRYRQKLMWVPVENRPVWVDDAHFNLDYHIRHAALPRPGDTEALKRLAARITTRALDRSRPLWELWVIEGLDRDRFAIVSKIHHCMVDGLAGAELVKILHAATPEVEMPEPRPYMPNPAPTGNELLADAVGRYVGMPLRALRGLSTLATDVVELREEASVRARALGDMVGLAMRPSSDTPLNGTLGPHRRLDWLTLSLADVKAVREAVGGTVNDVVLAAVTGAVRHYLMRRRVDPREIEFRVSAPVSVRSAEEAERPGNRISAWVLPLPIAKAEPLAWLEGVRAATREAKRSRQAVGLDMLMLASEYLPASLLAAGARMASGPMNMVVTNVPGPPFPLYMLGARMLELQPIVPLLDGTGLGIALFSYDGKLHVGLNAEYERVPDLGTFNALLAQSFMALADAAGIGVADDSARVPEPGSEPAESQTIVPHCPPVVAQAVPVHVAS